MSETREAIDGTGFPRRAVSVWTGLIALTCATAWLGTDHPFSSVSVRLAASIALMLAFAKVWFIGMDFMEVRHAPKSLVLVFNLWVAVIGGGLLILFLT